MNTRTIHDTNVRTHESKFKFQLPDTHKPKSKSNQNRFDPHIHAKKNLHQKQQRGRKYKSKKNITTTTFDLNESPPTENLGMGRSHEVKKTQI